MTFLPQFPGFCAGYDASVDATRLSMIELQGADGATHRLGDYWSERPVILVFLRHFG